MTDPIEQYVEHKGVLSQVIQDGDLLKAQVVGGNLYEVWVSAETIEDLAVKFGQVRDMMGRL